MVKWKWKVWSEFQNNSWKHHIIIFSPIERKYWIEYCKHVILWSLFWIRTFVCNSLRIIEKKLIFTKSFSYLRESTKYLSEDLLSIRRPLIKDFTLRSQNIAKKTLRYSCAVRFLSWVLWKVWLSRHKTVLHMVCSYSNCLAVYQASAE